MTRAKGVFLLVFCAKTVGFRLNQSVNNTETGNPA